MTGENEFYGFPGTKKKPHPPVRGWGFLIGALVEGGAVYGSRGNQDFLIGLVSLDVQGL